MGESETRRYTKKDSSCQLQPLSSIRLALVWENTHTHTHRPSPLPLLLFHLCLSSEFNFVFSKRRLKCRQSYQWLCKQWGTWLKHPWSISNADKPFRSLNCVCVLFLLGWTRTHKHTKTPALAHLPHLDLQQPPLHSVVTLYSSLGQ